MTAILDCNSHVDDAPDAPESGVRLAAPRSGFSIHNRAGDVIATEANIEDALATQRDMDDGEDVRRVSDGAVMATKYRIKGGGHIYSWAWRLVIEPAWESR